MFCLFMFFVIFEEPITNWINAKAEGLHARAKLLRGLINDEIWRDNSARPS